MLVKNIPYGTTLDELHEMFSSHGDISRLLLPAAGTMAVVEFVHPVDAQSAFKAIAYRRLKNSIIYLEKAPLGIFAPSKDGQPNRGKLATGIKPVTIAEQSLAEARPAEDEEFASGSTLFIKNLNFSTTSDRLTRVFQGIPSFSFARVQMKPDPKNPSGPRLSMGYGFVGFKDAEAARKAVKSLQGFTLDGHALLVKFAQRGVEEEKGKDAKGVGKSKTTKMIVKNVPFEATTKDIRELFGYASTPTHHSAFLSNI
jgi:multiple RNA-binding domain-containing protein 1